MRGLLSDHAHKILGDHARACILGVQIKEYQGGERHLLM
jgi:hypothetical protein